MEQSSEQVRHELVKYSRIIMEKGLVQGPGGNISARCADTMFISPSGFAFDDVAADDFVSVDIETGNLVSGRHRPSSEVLMHLFCYRVRPDVAAVVHTHPTFTIALLNANVPFQPAFADFVVYCGDKWPVLEYITVTTEALARAAEEAVKDAGIVLMKNHGLLTVGANLKEAYYRTAIAEEQARVQCLSMLLGRPDFLTKDQADELKMLSSEEYRRELLRKMKA